MNEWDQCHVEFKEAWSYAVGHIESSHSSEWIFVFFSMYCAGGEL